MQSTRLPRFQRDTNQIAAMRLTDRDREIVRLVHDHRFLRSDHLTALLPGSQQTMLRRLQLLYHHGFVERPRCQIEYYQRGSRRMAYGIGHKGAVVLKRELALPYHRLHWGEKNRVGRIFLDHALLISDVMVAVEIACRNRPDVRLLKPDEACLPYSTGKKRKPFQWAVDIGLRQKCGVIPDRMFGLEFTDARGQKDRQWFFLEADRATMPITRDNLEQSSIYRKLLAYRATWIQGIHRSRFGFDRFRVLTVTTNAERLAHMVAGCSHLESGRGLFIFADAASLLREGNDLLSHQWQNGFGKSETWL